MFILLTFLVTGVDFKPTCLDSLTGKWTIAGKMSSLLIFSKYSIFWRPYKTVMIGIEGSSSSSKKDDPWDIYDEDGWDIFLGIGFYKYFRTYDSFSPFITFSPSLNISHGHFPGGQEYLYQSYSVNIASGVEYFFSFFDKQFSLRLISSLASFCRYYDNLNLKGEDYDYDYDILMDDSIDTHLCFHF